jgi:hypothetical protein
VVKRRDVQESKELTSPIHHPSGIIWLMLSQPTTHRQNARSSARAMRSSIYQGFFPTIRCYGCSTFASAQGSRWFRHATDLPRFGIIRFTRNPSPPTGVWERKGRCTHFVTIHLKSWVVDCHSPWMGPLRAGETLPSSRPGVQVLQSFSVVVDRITSPCDDPREQEDGDRVHTASLA